MSSATPPAARRRTRPHQRVNLTRPEASSAQVRAVMPEFDVVHFACHGKADLEKPRSSAINLADDLTIADLLSARSGSRLVVLSACESAVTGIVVPDEVVSLPSGFLQAGASGVTATMVAVHSEPTALLMARYYEFLADAHPAAALRAAQRWLRGADHAELAARFPGIHPEPDIHPMAVALWRPVKPYSHPSFWAPFSHTGW